MRDELSKITMRCFIHSHILYGEIRVNVYFLKILRNMYLCFEGENLKICRDKLCFLLCKIATIIYFLKKLSPMLRVPL